MTLNEYIAHLQAFRDANPGAGKQPVVFGDELDSPYYSELTAESAQPTLSEVEYSAPDDTHWSYSAGTVVIL